MVSEYKVEYVDEEPTPEELEEIEKSEYDVYGDEEGGYFCEDSTNLYLNEIGNIPLLIEEEELKCGRDLEIGKRLKIVTTINKNPVLGLDFGKLFVSLENNANKNLIITTLIDYYSSKVEGNYKGTLELLRKYQSMCEKLGRTPNLAELTNSFRELNFNLEKIEEMELLNEVRAYLRYLIAYDKMVNNNLRLVVTMSKPYARKCQLPILDIIGEGNLGLIKAVSKFDVSKGFRFSTYATWWIRQAISRYLYANSSSLKVPEYIAKDAKRIRKEIEELEKKEGRKIPISELAKMYKMKEETILGCITTAIEDVISFSQPVGETEDSTVEEYLFDERDTVENEYFSRNINEDINFLFGSLTPREVGVIKLRFGIGTVDGNTCTLEEVGKKYNLTRERIRQIEAKALKKMRKVANGTERGRDLKDYLH